MFTLVSDGMLTIEGLGTRPLSDFEQYPDGVDLRESYVRLAPEATVRDDKISKEVVLLPAQRVQDSL